MEYKGDVKPIRFWCQKVLPLVYDDSLSYYECIDKFAYKLNELIDVLNNYQQEYKNYVDEEVEKLKKYVDNADANINSKINAEISKLESKHDKDISDIRFEIEMAKLELNEIVEKYKYDLESLRKYVIDDQIRQDTLIDIKLKEFYNKVLELINSVNDLIRDPTNGQWNTIQNTIDNIYNYLRYGAFDCVTYDGYNKTCDWWDTREFMAKPFDINGLTLWGQPMCECWMVNPLTGLMDRVTNVINQIITRTAEALTAKEFDDATVITALYYDDKGLTAYQYDFQGKIYLP